MKTLSEHDSILIVGGGHAGVALCSALVSAGLGGRTHLVCDEAEPPYQRPPLSKVFLKNPAEVLQRLRSEAWYLEAGITVHRADKARAIDRAAKTLVLSSGTVLPYEWLVLATGASARVLPSLNPTPANAALLRSAADALRLRTLLDSTRRVTVLGGGFIGLEIAATARTMGKDVTVLEAAPRLLQRSVSAELAEHVLTTHRASGITMRIGVTVNDVEVVGNRVTALAVDGTHEAVDLLVMGIGAAPETQLARDCGLDCNNGIVVDASMRSSDPAILAIGDCANFPEHGGMRRLRLESVQNANDQARTALATLSGAPEAYRALPWFWSEQAPMRLQMAGLMPADATRHRRSGATAASFSILHYVGSRLACVESVNAPADHMAARKLLDAGSSPEPTAACDSTRPLKQFLDER